MTGTDNVKMAKQGVTPLTWKNSEARRELLKTLVEQGEQAKLVEKFAKAAYAQVCKEVLERLTDPTADPKEAQGLLIGARSFYDLIIRCIAQGNRSDKAYAEMLKSR